MNTKFELTTEEIEFFKENGFVGPFTLYEEEEAIKKWDEALTLQPDNCELLYYRGTAHMNDNRRTEACKDYSRVKELLGITWFEDIRRLVCGF